MRKSQNPHALTRDDAEFWTYVNVQQLSLNDRDDDDDDDDDDWDDDEDDEDDEDDDDD